MAKSTKPRTITINTGANIKADSVRRWAQRKLKTVPDVKASTILQELMVWLDLAVIRNKKPGGLGRETKKQKEH